MVEDSRKSSSIGLAQFKAFFELSLDLFTIIDDEGFFCELNPAWSGVLGFSLQELKGRPFVDFIHPDDVEASLQEASRLASGEHKTIAFLNRYRHKDGHYLWFEWTASFADGFILAAARDVSELHEKARTLDNLEQAARIGSWSLNPKTMKITWSPETYRIHEVTLCLPIDTQKGIEFYAPEARPIISKAVSDALEKHEDFDLELPFITAKDKHKWVRAIGKVIVENDVVVELFGTFQDVTTEVHLRKEKLKKEMQLDRMIRNTPGMVYQFQVDAKGVSSFPFVSSKAFEIYEIPPETFQESPDVFLSMVYPEDAEELQKSILKSMESLEVFKWEGRILTKSGKVKWIHAESIPERMTDGGTLWDGLLLDISGRKALQDEVEQRRKRNQHQEKLAALGELSAGVGHEINNPLAILMGKIESLAKHLDAKKVLDEKTKKLFEDQREASKRVRKIVEGLRSFARKDSGGIETVNLVEVVEGTIGLFSEALRSDDIWIEFQRSSEELWASVSRSALQQVLTNLVVNASQALDGRVDKRICITLKPSDSGPVIEVLDNGSGIPIDIREKVFQPFFTTKEEGKGTGLGLSTCATLLKGMGGKLELLDSEKGCKFLIGLQAAAKPQRGEKFLNIKDKIVKGGSSRGLSILLVDDEAQLRELLRELLEEAGHQVEEAENGQVAWDLLQKKKFDAVFTDMKMPVMNGAELIAKFSATEKRKTTKLFVVTGGVEQNESNEVVLKLADGVLHKPFDENELLKRLSLCEKKAA